MQEIPVTASDEEVKQVIRYWINLLARGRFDEAVNIISPETIPANGSVNTSQHPRWTADLLDAVIRNGGTLQSWKGSRTWKVVPVEDAFRQVFEDRLSVLRGPFARFGKPYCGGVHVDLPWDGERGNCVGDLTARFLLREVGNDKMVLVLEDIHVL